MSSVALILLLGASWPQKLRAVEKQAGLLQERARALVALCDESLEQGRPHALSALRSESIRIADTVDRLDARVRQLSAQ